jgi:hypothetical protein
VNIIPAVVLFIQIIAPHGGVILMQAEFKDDRACAAAATAIRDTFDGANTVCAAIQSVD